MINKLRAKFIGITMVLVATLLLIILLLICSFTWSGMRAGALGAMQVESAEPLPGASNVVRSYLPCFIISLDDNGHLAAWGSNQIDLSDTQQLMQILEDAKATGQRRGLLPEYQLRFARLQGGAVDQYVFADISSQVHTMKNMLTICIVTYVLSLMVFFLISFWLSAWITRPVELAWAQQRQFVADASHELKTPLTVILTNAELLQSPDYDRYAKERSALSILTMSQQMRFLVEGLLDLARVDDQRTGMQMSTLDVSDLAENCVMTFEPLYFESGRQLTGQIQPQLYVKGDSRYLRQVFDILLDNGIKYSSPNSQIRLTMEQYRNRCLLQVSSQGQALTEQQCKEIFQRFYRLDEARSHSGNYGLGLPIARGIVAKHRGKIWAQSKEGTNTFFVSLPLSKPQA